jgi:5'(3')-deoxyribonucleotidase
VKFFELASDFKSKPIVYVDMDGVLADFFGKIAREHGVDYWREIHRQEIGIDQIAQEPEFFSTLPPMPNARQLMMGIIKLSGDYSILSSPLLSAVEQSSREKSEWLDKHIHRHQPKAIVYDHEKYKYAMQPDGTPNILIDDWDTNIELWKSNGGIGILHKDKDYKKTLKILSAALQGKIPHKNQQVLDEEYREYSHDKLGKLYTAGQVLKYINGIHHDYHLEKPIKAHKIWTLKFIPVGKLKTPEYVHQDDPYRRVIDIDWDHVNSVSVSNINKKPIVIDHDGWILDGNHRAMAAKANGVDQILALVPYTP